ncbi:MAG: hypothetical protein NTZ97_02040 [Candidatus Moranbacteria bacterium]|nr:hypothetical protein [Candidatus Moranbacteria bacterium]
MQKKWITARTFPDVVSAEVCKTKLESEGIQCEIENDELINMNPLNAVAYGGVKLGVKIKDAKKALEIFHQLDAKEIYNVTEEDKKRIENNKLQKIKNYCPNCGSLEIFREPISKRAFALSVLLLGFPIIFKRGKWHCFNCKNNWK